MNRSDKFWIGDSFDIKELLPQHSGQEEFFKYFKKYKFLVVPCGRRFGKTSMIAEVQNPLVENAYDREMAILMPETKDADPLWYYIEENYKERFKRKDGTKRRIDFGDDGKLEFWTIPNQSKKDAGRGRKYALVIYDETQKFRGNLLDYHLKKVIYPLMLDYPDAKVVFFGTPNGKGTFFHKLARRGAFNGNKDGLLGGDPSDIPIIEFDETNPYEKWITIRRPTSANPHIDTEGIEEMRKEFDEQTAYQEIDARFVDYAGEVWCSAIKSKQIQDKVFRTGLRVDWTDTIYLSFDFNKSPQTAVMFQLPPFFSEDSRYLRGIEFKKEFRTDPEKKSSIYDTIFLIQKFIYEETGRKIGKWYAGKREDGAMNLVENNIPYYDIVITGDASGDDNGDGKQRTPKTYYQIITDELNLNYSTDVKIPSKNPYHAESYVQVNTYLERHPKMYLDVEKCPHLKHDMLNVKSNIHRGIDKDDALLTHLLDCFRYGLNTFRPLIEQR